VTANNDYDATGANLGAYGDVLDMAVKVPTVSGVLVALAVGTFVWVWNQFRRPRTV
jgi:hypothetical protein